MTKEPHLRTTAAKRAGVARTTRHAAELEAGQVRLLFQQAPVAFLATAVNSVLLVYMLRDQIPLSWLGVWFGALLVLTLVRMRLVQQYRREDPPPADAARWGRRFVAGSLLSGIIWGSAGALFFPDDSAAHQMFLAFVLGGMAAGGMSTLSSYRGAYPIFLLPTLLPYAARAMLNGGEIQFTMSLMVLFFATMMWTISLRIYRRLEESLFLRFHNMDLLSTVLLARDRQQAANLELQAEIAKKQRAEQALQSAYVDLERRVRERTEELALSNDILVREKELFRITLASIGDAVITTDSNGRMTYLNAAAEQFTGWTSEEAIGMPLRQGFLTLDEITREPIGDPLTGCREPGRGPGHGNPCILLRRDNQELAIDQSVAPIRDRKGRTIGAVLTFRDVTEQRQLTRKLSHQATHDALTGLVNRHEFERRLSQVLLSAEATDPHALLYLDLDQFKVVNDTCGHIAGDELLRQVAALLQSKVRVHDTLARLGGDEFGILLEHCPQAQAIRIANTLRELIQGFRFGWEDKSFTIGVSVGLFSISRPGESLANALSAADSACYAAKDMGRNRVHTYEPDDSVLTKRQGEMRWLPRIQQALVDERLRLYYQPIVPIGEDHGEGDNRHGEILLRLLDEQGSLIPPGAFLPAAERYDQMLAIDRWVVRSCLERLPTPAGGERGVIYAINLSAQALGDSDFLEFVVDQIKEKGPAPSSICFEITENAAIADLRHVMRFISTLKEYGCRFSLDDFGSGLSSFGYLKTLPVDFLKIDGRLVRDMVTNKVDRSMVEAIHNIGHVMGIKTIAEWVEDAETLNQLREIGVNFAQGYGLAEPMPFVPHRLTRPARMN